MSAMESRQLESREARRARLAEQKHLVLVEVERKQGLADARQAAKARRSPLTYIDCRTFGHSWVPIEADRNPAIGWYIVARCDRCSTVRKQVCDARGAIARGAQYTYPDSYKDTDHWTRSDWRMQFLRRFK